MTKLADMDFNSIQDEQGNELPVSFALFESKYEFFSKRRHTQKGVLIICVRFSSDIKIPWQQHMLPR